jgi:hypothetical protein
MGYYKQKQIGGQVEVADRVPAPRPASSHVSLVVTRREMRKPSRDYVNLVMLGAMFGTFVLGVVIGVMA